MDTRRGMISVLSVLWALPAGASPVEPIVIGTAAGSFELGVQGELAAARLALPERTCVVGLRWSPSGLEVDRRDCPSSVADDVVRGVSSWTVRAPAGLAERQDLGELWFVYPTEAPGPPSVMIRQAHDRTLSLPAEVDAVPFLIRAWSFVRYPAAVHRDGVPDVSCTVAVRADTRGVAVDVRVDDCGDPYREAVRSAVTAWRFEPPLVGGQPIPTGLVLRATFVSEAPPPTERFAPSAESQRLWAERQFGELSRSERIDFIEAALLGEPERDLGPGQVLVSLPGAPDLGDRTPPSFWLAGPARDEVPPLPDHPPILVLGKPEHTAIEVFALPLPAPGVFPTNETVRCPLLVQVDGERRVFSWATAACDPSVRSLALSTADGWLMRHDGPPVHSTRARIEATLVFEPGGSSRVVLPADAVRTPQSELPPGVHTSLGAKPTARVPPRLPRDLPLPDAECVLAVTVTVKGRPRDVRTRTCPAGFESAAIRSVKQWRWRPAEEDAQPVESETEVRIRFSP